MQRRRTYSCIYFQIRFGPKEPELPTTEWFYVEPIQQQGLRDLQTSSYFHLIKPEAHQGLHKES